MVALRALEHSGAAPAKQPSRGSARRPGSAFGLANSSLVRLARTPDGRRRLARWHQVATGAYAAASPVGSVGQPFTMQDEDITIGPRPAGAAGAGISYARHQAAAPNLKVADDNSIAVQDGPGEAKDAYLDPTVRANANTTLANRGSSVELVPAGHTVTVNAHGPAPQRVLERVRPQVRAGRPGAAVANAQDFPNIAAMICRDAAQTILGGELQNVRLEDTHGHRASIPADTSDPNIVTGTQQLADAVARRRLTLADAATQMALATVPKPGKKYGRATRKLAGRNAFGPRAADIGINEDAWAHEGEAYVIQSIYSRTGDTRNYSDPAETPVDGGFGYHFAAVVAEALNGRDAVTLENYRRSGEVEQAATQLLQHLKANFAHHVSDAVLYGNVYGGAPRDQEKIGAILHYIETHAAADFNQASAKWDQIVREGFIGPTVGGLWYFRLVGKNPAQSFHRELSASGWFPSPMTLVMTR